MQQQSKTESKENFKMTELGPLPADWEVVRLGDVANLVMGQSPPGNTYNEIGDGVPFLQGKAEFSSLYPKHVKYTTKPLKIAPKGSVLMSVRAPVGDVNIAQIDYCVGRGLASISLYSEDNTFLFYLSIHLKSNLEKEGTGSTFKAINKTKLMNFKIPLPPLPEQQKIATILSTIQEAKEKTKSVINTNKELKKSLMKHLFTYGPVPLSEAGNVKLRETEIGMVPEGWEVVRLEGVAEKFLGGGTPSTLKNEYWGGDIEWTTSKKINNGIYLWNGEKKITRKGLEESSTHLIPKDNLIIGTRVGVGKVVINKVDTAISQDLTGVFIKKESYNLEFLAYQISNNNIQKIFLDCMRGTTIKGIPRDDLEKIPIILPPLRVQQKIASILLAVDKKIRVEENKRKALDELFKSMLHNLMTGKIRVNELEVEDG